MSPDDNTIPTSQQDNRSRGAELQLTDLADVPYGDHRLQTIDFWHARGSELAPVVVYIHGGGFRAGDKSGLPPHILSASLDAGLAVAAVNYRLSDEVSFPTFMLDSARAIQFIRAQGRQWGVDGRRMAATGGSAGGGISLWLGFHPDLADGDSGDPVARQSTGLTCLGVYNTQCSYDPNFFRDEGLAPAATHPFMLPFYGLDADQLDTPRARELFRQAAPMTWFHSAGPPVFIYYPSNEAPIPADAQALADWSPGEADHPDAHPLAGRAVHHPKMGRMIKRMLDELGVECELHVNAGGDLPAIQRRMVEFLARRLERA